MVKEESFIFSIKNSVDNARSNNIMLDCLL